MKYTTLETIHDLLKTAMAAAETEYKKAQEEYNETQRLLEEEGEDESPELLVVLEQDKDHYESCRERCSRLDDAICDFNHHEFR